VGIKRLLKAVRNWLIPEEKENYKWIKVPPCGTRDEKYFLRLENWGEKT